MSKKRMVSLMVAAVLTLSTAITGCSAKGNAPAASSEGKETSGKTETKEAPQAKGEVLTLTLFDKNASNEFTDSVAKVITEKTGVFVEIQQPSGNPDEKLSLMLASGDLPDIVFIDRRSDMMNKYIAAGAVIPLNDLIDEYAPNIKEMYGEISSRSRSEDGQNYFLNNWYGVDEMPDRGILLRMDVLEEIGYGERAEAGDYFTQDEFVDMLKKFKEVYGADAIPFTINGEYMETVMSTFRGMYGMKNYYEKDSQIFLSVRDPKYLEMVKFINELSREGLIDNEWAVNKQDIVNQKLASGKVMACNGGIPTDVNNIFKEDEGDGTNKQFYQFKIVADGTDPNATTYSPRPSLGWDGACITVSNEHPVETIKFLDFLASEEGQYLMMWGVEGEHWDYVDGVHTPRPEIIPGFQNDWGEYAKATGIRKWGWLIKNGVGADGTPYDLVTKYELDAINEHAKISMKNSVYDTAPYDDISPAGGTPEALVEQKLKDIMDQGFSKMVYAKSEEEVDSEYQNMIAELEANDAASIEKIYSEKYKAKMVLWSE